MKTAAIGYVRVSTDKQADTGSSIENQSDRIRKYCEFNGLELKEIIVDGGFSGRNGNNRPGFIKMMGLVEDGSIDHVIVNDLSRLCRNLILTITTINKMTKHDCQFHAINNKIDTTTAAGKMMLGIFATLHEFESNQTGEKIKEVKNFNKSKRKTYSSPVYGYTNDKENKVIVPIEGEQAIVSRIIEMKHNNLSLGQIVKTLSLENVPTKNGGKWHRSTVRNICNNTIHRKVA